MSYFPWSEEYSVHLRVIDNDHKDLVNTVNALHEAIGLGATRAHIGHIISNLVTYVDAHFSREEALMETYDYPDRVKHKRIHRHLTRAVYAIRIVFTNDPRMIDPNKFLAFLRDWLVHHILQEDTKYVPYLRGDMEQGTSTPSDVTEPLAAVGPSPVTRSSDEKTATLTLTVPAAKAAALRRCARLLTDGGNECIAIEEIVMPVSNMTYDEALHFASPVLR